MEANREKVYKSNAEWRKNNPDKNSARLSRWSKENRAKRCFAARARKARIKAIDELLPGEWEAMVKSCNNTCIVPGCSGSPVVKDHVMPLSKGGRHHISNIQPLCRPCNGAKHTKTVDYR